MRKDGQATVDRIIATAQDMFLSHGFRGTSVDLLTERIGITKGAFFYHFKNKDELALAAMRKWVEADKGHYDDFMKKAETLSDDPREQVLLFVGLFIDMMDRLTEPYPGCLYAAYIYESGYVNKESLALAEEAMRFWRANFGAKIREAIAAHPPKAPVDVDALADGITAVFEGAFIMAKILNDPKIIGAQLREYRAALEARLS